MKNFKIKKISQNLALYAIEKLVRFHQNLNKEKWVAGQDWVKYSGLVYDDREFIAAIKSLIKGWMILGEKGREFEKQFSKFLGKKDGIFTNSGSSANLLMVSSLSSKKTWGLKRGAKFITPVVCFPTTINPLIQNGFIPVFVDVELPNLNLNLNQVEELLEKDTNKEIKGIIFAHVLGNPPDMDRLMSIVKKYNLIFLEDTCDALGSSWDNKPLGSFGHMSSCSFFPAHHMSTGEGGFVATNNTTERLTLASFRDWGRDCYCNSLKAGDVTCGTACGNRFKPWFSEHIPDEFDHRYVFSEIGYNLKPLELQACIGLEQIKKLPYMHQCRKENYSYLYDLFSKYSKYFFLTEKFDKADVSWFGFLLTVKDGAPFTKNDIVQYLESCKIQTRSYFTGNALFHPAYQDLLVDYPNPKEQFPVATKSTKDTFFLGTFAGIDIEQLEYIKKCVEIFMSKYNA